MHFRDVQIMLLYRLQNMLAIGGIALKPSPVPTCRMPKVLKMSVAARVTSPLVSQIVFLSPKSTEERPSCSPWGMFFLN